MRVNRRAALRGRTATLVDWDHAATRQPPFYVQHVSSVLVDVVPLGLQPPGWCDLLDGQILVALRVVQFARCASHAAAGPSRKFLRVTAQRETDGRAFRFEARHDAACRLLEQPCAVGDARRGVIVVSDGARLERVSFELPTILPRRRFALDLS